MALNPTEKLFEKSFLYHYDKNDKHPMTKLFGKNLIVMHCEIWYYLYNLKNVNTTHAGVLFLVKLQASLQLY